jgi:hypothetical protein
MLIGWYSFHQEFKSVYKSIFMAKSKKTAGKKTAGKKVSGKRELIEPNSDKRYIRRDSKGRIRESTDQGKSLSLDKKKSAKTKVKPGYGDKGDQLVKKGAAKKKAAPKKAAPKKRAAAKKKAAKRK